MTQSWQLELARDDGYWELLATALGHPEALMRTRQGLNAAEIEKGAMGLALAPSLIRERVEALAAYDPVLLVELSKGWLRPHAIGGADWWIAAWEPALRHLAACGAIDAHAIDEESLARERNLLWPRVAAEACSWRELLTAVGPAAGGLRGDTLRRLAHCELSNIRLGAAEVEAAPPPMLRLLRGRWELLDESARASISRLARAQLAGDGDPFEAAIVVEAALACATLPLEWARQALAARLHSAHDPRELIPLFYVLAGNWRVP